MKKIFLFLTCACALMGCKHSLSSREIRLNQVGFAPQQEKTATIDVCTANAAPCSVFILSESGDTVWTGTASTTMLNSVSSKPRQIVDFSSLTTSGIYTIHAAELSATVTITARPYRFLTRQALRAFYHQRTAIPIEEPFAEGYARAGGHPDSNVLIHPSAATDERPANTVIASPGGWYDAGDYNKYIVNSGYTMGVFLMAYEQQSAYYDTLSLNIPESELQIPDMLAEAMYNIRWMLTMQDTDGGVYHKLTNPEFEGFIRPDECQKPRYVVLKTTAAALDFAATMALAARIYAPYENVYPGFVADATAAALRAWDWALAHPAIYYDQNAMNDQYTPAIITGAYDDYDVQGEFYWAATELYLLTHDNQYREAALAYCPAVYTPAVWGDVAELASIEWMLHPQGVEEFAAEKQAALLAYLQPYLDEAESISVHRSPYGNREEDFFWGCNSEGCCWRGIQCLYAYHLTDKNAYLVNAERCLNHVLGQNATGYCYVTGFGTKPTKDPHHRLSYSHPKGTLPGFLAGGPNRMKQDAETDGVRYPKNVSADESYLDFQPSYASNEVTINWNVTLFALTAGLDALQQ